MENLTEIELKILKFITKGYSNCKIGKEIFLSEHTVKVHISKIIKKLDAENRTNAVCIAIKNKFIDL